MYYIYSLAESNMKEEIYAYQYYGRLIPSTGRIWNRIYNIDVSQETKSKAVLSKFSRIHFLEKVLYLQ